MPSTPPWRTPTRTLPKLAVLRQDTQAWWADGLAGDPDELGEGEELAVTDVEGLRRFLEGEALPWFENRKKELDHRR